MRQDGSRQLGGLHWTQNCIQCISILLIHSTGTGICIYMSMCSHQSNSNAGDVHHSAASGRLEQLQLCNGVFHTVQSQVVTDTVLVVSVSGGNHTSVIFGPADPALRANVSRLI